MDPSPRYASETRLRGGSRGRSEEENAALLAKFPPSNAGNVNEKGIDSSRSHLAAGPVGPRRHALSSVRRSDVDLVRRTIRFVEKGGKVARPSHSPASTTRSSSRPRVTACGTGLGPIWPAAVRRRVERSDKVIWDTVKNVAARAGVECHVHAPRAAFAVLFDEMHPGEGHTLKEPMGHSTFDTTLRHCLRGRDKARAMETVRDLSWGSSVFPSKAQRGAYGIRTRVCRVGSA